ncbi:hypothetical protein [Streptomyces sp. 6N223]|uniref:hypothetical protein n=1 Tax=Streptomyces sp. 6N223 TaxID=3457412 RepID=UPI003FD1AC3A
MPVSMAWTGRCQLAVGRTSARPVRIGGGSEGVDKGERRLALALAWALRNVRYATRDTVMGGPIDGSREPVCPLARDAAARRT